MSACARVADVSVSFCARVLTLRVSRVSCNRGGVVSEREPAVKVVPNVGSTCPDGHAWASSSTPFALGTLYERHRARRLELFDLHCSQHDCNHHAKPTGDQYGIHLLTQKSAATYHVSVPPCSRARMLEVLWSDTKVNAWSLRRPDDVCRHWTVYERDFAVGYSRGDRQQLRGHHCVRVAACAASSHCRCAEIFRHASHLTHTHLTQPSAPSAATAAILRRLVFSFITRMNIRFQDQMRCPRCPQEPGVPPRVIISDGFMGAKLKRRHDDPDPVYAVRSWRRNASAIPCEPRVAHSRSLVPND